jgi:hypothetical protein
MEWNEREGAEDRGVSVEKVCEKTLSVEKVLVHLDTSLGLPACYEVSNSTLLFPNEAHFLTGNLYSYSHQNSHFFACFLNGYSK